MKRLIALVLCLCFALGGCAQGKPAQHTEDGGGVTPAPSETPAPVEAPTVEEEEALPERCGLPPRRRLPWWTGYRRR